MESSYNIAIKLFTQGGDWIVEHTNAWIWLSLKIFVCVECDELTHNIMIIKLL